MLCSAKTSIFSFVGDTLFQQAIVHVWCQEVNNYLLTKSGVVTVKYQTDRTVEVNK